MIFKKEFEPVDKELEKDNRAGVRAREKKTSTTKKTDPQNPIACRKGRRKVVCREERRREKLKTSLLLLLLFSSFEEEKQERLLLLC
jgi:hypothetical protein